MLNIFLRDLAQPVQSNDHKRGNPNASVRIVIYADFADPELQTTHSAIRELIKNSGEDVLVVYRHFPQTLKHPYAFAAAQALIAAEKQDKFWEMLEQVLANQTQLTDGFLRQYARIIDLDKAQFEDDFSSADTLKRIEHDKQTAKDSNVETTPAIFINGVRQQTISMRFIQELVESGGEVSG